MSPKNNMTEPVDAASSTQQCLHYLANGNFGLAKYSYRNASDATKYVAREIQESSHTAKVADATKNLYNSVKDGAGQQVYQVVTPNPITGPVVRFAGAAIGSALTWNMMATSVASRAGRELVRASCIRNSMWIFNSLHLPNSLRAAAVYTGVNTHNYIASGLIPGLFTALAIYDGYRVARYCYNMYQDRNKGQLQGTERFEESAQKWRNFYEDLAAQNSRICFFGMYAPQ